MVKSRRRVVVVRRKVELGGEDCRVADAGGCSRKRNGACSKAALPALVTDQRTALSLFTLLLSPLLPNLVHTIRQALVARACLM